ncbi:MAG TPA: response regulator [Burkholderiales bacterium]|nr:response regulator [Burkholderiales bacterium]
MTASVAILHLEDDPADARLIREQLRRSGLGSSITLVDNPEDFQAALSRGGFDLILSDYHIPRISGHEALQLAKTVAPHIPFILVTGALGDERAVEVLRSGATDFVLKDRLARLAPAIERALSERAARKEHENTEVRLADAHRLSKLAADAARIGTWQLDVASGRMDCSEEFLNLIEVAPGHWAKTLDGLEGLMHPEDVGHCRQAYAEAVKQGHFLEMEFRVHTATGEVRWMHLRGDWSPATTLMPSMFLGVMMDITQRKRMEEALRVADRRKDEFLATLGHELRNPLAPIHNGLAILRKLTPQSGETEKIHTILDRQMNHIIRLVDDLLDISRFTLGKIELRRAPVELRTLIRGAIDMSQPLIEVRRHRLDVSIPSGSIMLDADSVRLTQVLSNLLNNAARYTGESGSISIRAGVEGGRAVISVRDNGVGIPEPMLERIFDLFTQVEGGGAGSVGGLGIGLAMARLLVELHGGEIEARSDGPGMGSEFVIRLPVSASDEASVAVGNASAADTRLSGRRILVVDDNCDSADSMGMLLELAGAEVTVVYDGESALAVVDEFRPDAVMLDLGMPGMDGYDVAQRIRGDARHRNLTLIALTGFGQDEDRERSAAAGFDHHLTKPADFAVVKALVASIQRKVAIAGG